MVSRYYVNRARSICAVILFTFVFIHLGNHILGIVGIEAMESMRQVTTGFVHSTFGTALLASALVIHFSIALRALYNKPFLVLPRWQQWQLVSGITLVLLLIPHAVAVRGINSGFGVDTTYPLVLQHLWADPWIALRQSLLLTVAWLHLCTGFHHWLKTKHWYRRHLGWMYALAILWPVLALIGFVQAGYESFDYDVAVLPRNDGMAATISAVQSILFWTLILLCVLMLILKTFRQALERRARTCVIQMNDNLYRGLKHQSILNALRFARVPHASVCGGRGRCTTCRIRVDQGMENLEPVGELEQLALDRIKAPPPVRLACQAVLKGDVKISALLPVDATMRMAFTAGNISGEEKQVVAMFIDLRESTRLAEQKLPYDVLYILNQFLTRMAESLNQTNGHYAQFAGDGLMALYGLNTDLKTGCLQALQGALDMQHKLEELNRKLDGDLEWPLRIGIGIHCGEAIAGTMGPPKSPNYSAIGDNINIAARLEAKTKELGCWLVVSDALITTAGLDIANLESQSVTIRGRDEKMTVYLVHSTGQLSQLLETTHS